MVIREWLIKLLPTYLKINKSRAVKAAATLTSLINKKGGQGLSFYCSKKINGQSAFIFKTVFAWSMVDSKKWYFHRD